MIRLRQLDLEFFGRFTGKTIDFGDKPEGSDFHIVYGPNEAGKTTTMEGFLRLLYGFPTPSKEAYAFRHEHRTLKVAGVLDFGARRDRVLRQTTRGQTLVDAHGAALGEQTLQAHLGGLDERSYRDLLCLDDATIERGGEDIVNAKGDIGSLLFSAAAGIGGLTEVLDDVRARADALYKKRGSTSRMAILRHELREVAERLRAEDVSAGDYRKLRASVQRGEQAEEQAADAARAHRTALERLKLRRAAVPKLAEIDRLAGIIAAHPDAPARLDADPERLVDLIAMQRQAKGDDARLSSLIETLTAERDGIVLDPDHRSRAEILDGLDELRSRHALAAKDLPRRRKQMADVLEDMRGTAMELGADDGTDPATLVVGEGVLVTLEGARERMRSAMQAVPAEESEVERLRGLVGQAKAGLDVLGPAPTTEIGATLSRAGADALATRHATAAQAMADAARRAHEARDALVLKGRSFTSLPTSPLTGQEADALATEHDRLTIAVRSLAEQRDETQDRVAAMMARMRAIESESGEIDDEAAFDLSEHRERMWQAHRATLTEATAGPFETAMRAVDANAATRLTGARAVAELRQLRLDAETAQQQLARTDERHGSALGELASLDRQLEAALQQLGLATPLSWRATSAWIERLEEAHAAMQHLARTQAEHADTFARADGLTAELAPHFDLTDPDLETLLDAARRAATAEREAREERRHGADELRRLEAELALRIVALDALRIGADEARDEWRALVADTFGSALAPQTLEPSLAPLHRLRELDVNRADRARQIETMEEDQRQFAVGLAGIAGAVTEGEERDTFARLQDASRAANDAEALHRTKHEAIAAATVEREQARRILADIDAQADALAAAFPPDTATGTLNELRDAMLAASDVISARTDHDHMVGELCTDLDAAALEDIRAMLADATVADLNSELLEGTREQERLDRVHGDAIATRAAAQRDLQAITPDADMAALAERKMTLELEMQQAALAHLELHMGHSLATEAIRRYRDAHRSGMMTATQTAFAELTDGAYTRLTTQSDGAGETLIAIGADGQSKQATQMSKGTRFQLYLALRAAAYEQLAAQGTVLPFFCDDIFETFDNDRTRAACRLMQRIGTTGQAIYLTHHAHVVDIARDVCGDGVRFHEL